MIAQKKVIDTIWIWKGYSNKGIVQKKYCQEREGYIPSHKIIFINVVNSII